MASEQTKPSPLPTPELAEIEARHAASAEGFCNWSFSVWAERHAAQAHTDRAALLTYIRQLPKWMPIESAPKNGTRIDIWMVNERLGTSRRVTNCSWGRYDEDSEAPYGDYHWRGLDGDDRATHWMPLPKEPQP